MMGIIYEIVEFAATFIEFFIAFRILESIFRARKRHKAIYWEMAASLAGAVLISFCNRITLFSYLGIVVAGFYMMIVAGLLFGMDLMTAFSMVSFYLLCLNYFDFLILTLISVFFQGADTLEKIISDMGVMRAFVIMLVKILWVILYLVLKKYIERLSVKVKDTAFLFFTAVAGFTGFVYLVDQTRKEFHNTLPIMWFGIICFLVSIIFVRYYKVMDKEQKWKLDFLEMRNALLCENYQSMSEIYAQNAELYHDINNHLHTLYQLMEDGKINDAKEYIKEISKPVSILSRKVWTGLDVVDVVINSKLEKMERLGIRTEISIELPAGSHILTSDLCVILFNLLDNAIEAAHLHQDRVEPFILFTIRHIHHFVVIKIVNSLGEKPKTDVHTGQLQTTQNDGQYHGWGLKSVKAAVEKYNGTLEQRWDEQKFETVVLLFCPDK